VPLVLLLLRLSSEFEEFESLASQFWLIIFVFLLLSEEEENPKVVVAVVVLLLLLSHLLLSPHPLHR
tara:strand:- start:35 stop:235 length:201 start_codon:yes stop_codon:yes gene_type:complete